MKLFLLYIEAERHSVQLHPTYTYGSGSQPGLQDDYKMERKVEEEKQNMKSCTRTQQQHCFLIFAYLLQNTP